MNMNIVNKENEGNKERCKFRQTDVILIVAKSKNLLIA